MFPPGARPTTAGPGSWLASHVSSPGCAPCPAQGLFCPEQFPPTPVSLKQAQVLLGQRVRAPLCAEAHVPSCAPTAGGTLPARAQARLAKTAGPLASAQPCQLLLGLRWEPRAPQRDAGNKSGAGEQPPREALVASWSRIRFLLRTVRGRRCFGSAEQPGLHSHRCEGQAEEPVSLVGPSRGFPGAAPEAKGLQQAFRGPKAKSDMVAQGGCLLLPRALGQHSLRGKGGRAFPLLACPLPSTAARGQPSSDKAGLGGGSPREVGALLPLQGGTRQLWARAWPCAACPAEAHISDPRGSSPGPGSHPHGQTGLSSPELGGCLLGTGRDANLPLPPGHAAARGLPGLVPDWAPGCEWGRGEQL